MIASFLSKYKLSRRLRGHAVWALGTMLASVCLSPASDGEPLFLLGANVNEFLPALEDSLLEQSRTTWVRGFLPASPFITGKRMVSKDHGIRRLKECAQAGRRVILTIKWDLKAAGWRVPPPASPTEKAWFAWVDELLAAMRGKISMLAIVNELFIDTPPEDLVADATGRIPMVDFLQRLTRHIGDVSHRDTPIIYTGGFTRLDTAPMQKHPATLAMIAWVNADPRVAGVNFHLHQRDFDQFEQALRFIRGQIPSKPFIVTEFSLIQQYRAHLEDPLDEGFARSQGRSSERTVRDHINHCIAHPVSEAEWNDFIRSLPWIDPDFLRRACALMDAYGVRTATYAFSQKSSAGRRPLNRDDTPWLLNPFFIVCTARANKPGRAPVYIPWFEEYLRRQPRATALTPRNP
jgi:hypothetical protein